MYTNETLMTQIALSFLHHLVLGLHAMPYMEELPWDS